MIKAEVQVQLPSPLARHVWDGGSTCLGNIPLRERRSQTPLSAAQLADRYFQVTSGGVLLQVLLQAEPGANQEGPSSCRCTDGQINLPGELSGR